MTKPAKNEDALVDLVRILSSDMRTAMQIAIETGCSRAVAYDRLSALERRGIKFQKVRVRQGITGPKAIAYVIIDGSL